MTLKLYSSPQHKNVKIALITAEYSHITVELVPFPKERGEFAKILPMGETQVLKTLRDGEIFDINAIARYIALSNLRTTLFGYHFAYRLEVDQWIDFAMTCLDPIFTFLYKSLRQATFLDYVVRPEESSFLEKSFLLLNSQFANNSYLVGQSVTLADIITTCSLYFGFTMLLDKKYTSKFPHVERYFWYMVKQPNFAKILGDVKQFEV